MNLEKVELPGLKDVTALAVDPNEPGALLIGSSSGCGRLNYLDSPPIFTPLIDWGEAGIFHTISKILPIENDDPHYISLSNSVNFSISNQDFSIDDFTYKFLPMGNTSLFDIKVSNFMLNPAFNRSAGGAINFSQEGENPHIYGYVDILCDINVGGVSQEQNRGLCFFKGTAKGLFDPEENIEFDLQWISGPQTDWIFQIGPSLLSFFTVQLLARTDNLNPGPALDGSPQSPYIFMLDPEHSGIWLTWSIIQVPYYPLAKFAGHFSLSIEEALPEEPTPVSPTFFITSLLADEEGYILIGTQEDGLFVLPPNGPDINNRVFIPINSFPWKNISALALDEEGHLFVGTLQNGLYKLDQGYRTGRPKTTPIGSRPNQLLNPYVAKLEMTPNNILLIGMYNVFDPLDRGLTIYKKTPDGKERFESLTSADGLIPSRIQDILLDNETLYLATRNGLCIIQKFPDFIDNLFTVPQN